MRFSIAQLLVLVMCICLILWAFVRGRQLLGVSVGVVYAMIALATLLVWIRVVNTHRNYNRMRITISSIFAIGVFAFLSMPAQFNSDLAYFISKHQITRAARLQMAKILADDSRFARLHFDCDYAKVINLSVTGSVQSEVVFLELRNRIIDHCPTESIKRLHWQIRIVDSGLFHDDYDFNIFGELESVSTNPG